MALTDDTGAATSVTLSYTRLASGNSNGLSGAFAPLGVSAVNTATATLSGLLVGGTYQLAIISGWDGIPSFTVGGNTLPIFRTSDWSTLSSGLHYALFTAIADGAGTLSFTTNANPSGTAGGSFWTAFQLQDISASSVPEPGTLVLLGLGFTGLLARRRKVRDV